MTAPIIANWLGGVWALDVDGLVYAPGAKLTIESGDDYSPAEFRAFQFVNTNGTWIDLTGAAATLYVYFSGRQVIAVGGTVLKAVGPDQKVSFSLAKSDTVKLKTGFNPNYNYSVKVSLPNGDVVTLTEGKVTVS